MICFIAILVYDIISNVCVCLLFQIDFSLHSGGQELLRPLLSVIDHFVVV